MAKILQIPSKKFYPPRFSPEQCLYRGHLIEKELGLRGKNKQLYCIEAQAGQGKTTLIQQYLKRYEVPFSWYQFGEEDHDPVFFVAALLAGLSRKVQTLALPRMEHLLATGQVSAGDLAPCIEAILRQLASAVRDEYCLVFDDLHLLDNGGGQTLALLQQFIAQAPPHLLFFLAARRPSAIDFSAAFSPSQLLHLKNEQMALTLAETRELYQSIFQLDIPGPLLQEIHAMTGGWAMGLVSFAHSIAHAGSDVDLKRLLDLPRAREHYQDYFRQEVFDQVPDPLKESLLLLSLLYEIPVQLAATVTGRSDIGRDLAGLQSKNFFMRSLDDEGVTFGMHHLFAEFLRERASRDCSRQRVLDVYRLAAKYYLGEQALAVSLDYWIRAEAWDEVERLLERDGVTFIARNQSRTLALLLDKIPAAIRADLGWLLLFSAITDNEASVVFSLEQLEQARSFFEENGHRKGTLLALSQIIWLHMASTGLFHEGKMLLAPADRLYTAIQTELSIDEDVLICRNIGAGALLFDLDVGMNAKYHNHAVQLARDHRLWGSLNLILIFQAFALHFQGRIQECGEKFEEIYPYFFSDQIGVTGKLSILVLQMNMLESLREDEVYNIKKKNIPEHLSRQQMFSFILGPYLILWDLYLALVNGDFTRAAQEFDRKAGEIGALNPHYQSQILANYAYIFSLTGERDKALGLLERANDLRRRVAGRYYIALHRILAGATHGQCGQDDLAQNELEQAVDSLRDRGNNFLLVSALMHRAWLARKLGKAAADVLRDVDEALVLAVRHDIRMFRFLPPGNLEPLLLLAIQHGIQVDQAKKFARSLLRKGVTPQGQLIPLLELKFLGGISIRYQGRMACRSEDLPYLQRELLALLAAMPGQKISQEQVQALLWPESTAEKSRTNLDTLLSRLRTSLGASIPKNSLKHYITLQRGLLSLQHCAIDLLDFRREVEAGLLHLTGRQAWKAENCFLKALTAWKGPFAPEIFGDADQVVFLRSELLDCYAKMALGWGKGLREMGRTDEAIDLLRTAVSYLPTDDRLIRQLYHLLHEVSFQQAMKLLSEYRQALIREEYAPAEVEEIIAQVSGSRP